MKISKEQFFKVITKLGLPKQNENDLWNALEAEVGKDSSMSKLLYYFGAMIVISAMTWFMSLGWMSFGGGGIFLISVLYAILFALAGAKLWKKEELKIPAGLLITIAVCMTPLAIYGLEMFLKIFSSDSTPNYSSFYSVIKSSWIWMDIGTIVAGLVALKAFPFPFLTAPIFCAAWFLSMDVIPLLIGCESSFEQKAWISLAFSVLILSFAYRIDFKKMPRYGFWGYLFGTFLFCTSLSLLCYGKGEAVYFLYFLISLLMMFTSVFLKRKVLLIFGAIGVFSYFGHLAYDLFENSILFSFALTLLGLAVIYAGVLYQKNSEWIEKKMLGLIPKRIRKSFPFGED